MQHCATLGNRDIARRVHGYWLPIRSTTG